MTRLHVVADYVPYIPMSSKTRSPYKTEVHPSIMDGHFPWQQQLVFQASYTEALLFSTGLNIAAFPYRNLQIATNTNTDAIYGVK